MTRKRRTNALRTVGWLAVTGLIGMAVLGPAASPTLANDLHQDPPIAWNATGYGSNDCPTLESGEVLWHFVQTQVGDGTTSGKLSATFDGAGAVTADSYKKSGDTLHWQIITGHDTLESASSDVVSEGNLNLSHICVGPEASASPSQEPSSEPSDSQEPSSEPSDSQAPSSSPSESPSGSPSESPHRQALISVVKIIDQDGDLSTTDDETLAAGWHFKVTVTDGSADPDELVSLDDDIAVSWVTFDGDHTGVSMEEVPQQGYDLVDAICFQGSLEADLRTQALRPGRLAAMAESDEGVVGTLDGNTLSFDVWPDTGTICGFFNSPERQTSSPSGGVEGATGTPRLTPPSTDEFRDGTGSGPSGDSWRLLLVAMAGLLATILVLTPAAKTVRRD